MTSLKQQRVERIEKLVEYLKKELPKIIVYLQDSTDFAKLSDKEKQNRLAVTLYKIARDYAKTVYGLSSNPATEYGEQALIKFGCRKEFVFEGMWLCPIPKKSEKR